MIRGDRRVHADLHTRRRGRCRPWCRRRHRASPRSTRALSPVETGNSPDVTPSTADHVGAHDGGKALVCRSPAPGPSPDTPDHERRRPRTPPVLVGDPVLRQFRRRQTPPRSATNSRQPGLLERRAPATISFASPELTRKPPLPEPLPRSPYVTITRHREPTKSYNRYGRLRRVGRSLDGLTRARASGAAAGPET